MQKKSLDTQIVFIRSKRAADLPVFWPEVRGLALETPLLTGSVKRSLTSTAWPRLPFFAWDTAHTGMSLLRTLLVPFTSSKPCKGSHAHLAHITYLHGDLFLVLFVFMIHFYAATENCFLGSPMIKSSASQVSPLTLNLEASVRPSSVRICEDYRRKKTAWVC